MEKSVVNAGYDIQKMPLGELSKETVLKGYKILREIENVITNKNTGDLTDLSSQFYTNIPHNFGFQKMSNFIIRDEKTLKEKKDLVSFIKKMTKTFNAFKNAHAEIIERGKPSSETTKANTVVNSSATKPPRQQEGSMSARSNRSSSSQHLTNS